jgi:hypothetical protein
MHQSVDEAPRYGIRTLVEPVPSGRRAAAPDHIAKEAARLGLHHLAAAIEHRLTRPWAGREDALLVRLRGDHPEALRAAEQIVRRELGSAKSWRMKASAVHRRYLGPAIARRRAAGLAGRAWAVRLALIVLFILPSFLLVVGAAPLPALVLTGAASILAAFGCGRAVTVWLRLPVQPVIRRRWLQEFRRDIVDATLLALLQEKGAQVDQQAAEAAVRGWKHIRFVAAGLDRLDAEV